jgi:hypothetical protein
MPIFREFSVVILLSTFALTAGRISQHTPDSREPKAVVISSDESRVEELERQSWVSWQKRDGAFFQRFLSDDHVEVHATGLAGKQAVVATVSSPGCVVNSYRVGDFKVTHINADTILLNYNAAQDTVCFKKKVPSPAWVSSLYVRRNGEWLNILYQHSVGVVEP